ncbi:uncharacterized protein LOC131994683 [Stomoxys calcitrans]|uniref:uncharacterized protein LOC131994683 n=1 Tax=Stomoxys calcitrans TaxID=35570 RepID=UPI0027E381B5|nr:uncharacterized protein LOC131994683 [Stomoxys calcitrans]
MSKKPVGNMEVSDLVELMKCTMSELLEDKLQNLPTKQDIEEVKAGISWATSEISDLKAENAKLKMELELLKNKIENNDRSIRWLENQVSNTKLVFKGIVNEKPAINPVVKLCTEKLQITPAIKSAKTIFERGNVQTVVVEFDNETVASELGQLKFWMLPLYLRSVNWTNDFTAVKRIIEEDPCKDVIMIGDMNIRIGSSQQEIVSLFRESFSAGMKIRKSMDKEINSKGRTYLEFCNDNNLVILNGQTKGDEDGNFTFVSTVGESVNDICAMSSSLLQYVDNFAVEENIWSDHLPISLKMKFNINGTVTNRLKLLPKLSWKDNDKNNYQTMLNINLQNVLNTHEVHNLKDLTDIIVKSSVTTDNHSYKPKEKWYTERCHWARKKVFKSLRKFKKSSNECNKQQYLQAQRIYKMICVTSKKAYYSMISEQINNIKNSKEWWKLVREINNNHFHIGPNISASSFRDYFMKLLNTDQTTSNILYAPSFITVHLLDKEITVEEVKRMLQKVKLNKAPGEDRIPYEFFVNATDEFISELVQVYNTMYTNGIVDESFIKTVIFPIHKKGNVNETKNYRGISFMNSVAKIFMGVLNERLQLWIEERNILVEYQAGFRKNVKPAYRWFRRMSNARSGTGLINI